jgi:DNA-binding protein YbaB
MERNPKPILVIKMPASTSLAMIHQSHKYIEEKKIENDYHVLIVSNGNKEGVDIEVFYDKNIKETDVEQLKQLIKDGFESKSNKQE